MKDPIAPPTAVTARAFIDSFREAAQELSAGLIPIWRQSTTDLPYTNFMTNQVFPATARRLGLHPVAECSYMDKRQRSRRLDFGMFPVSSVGGVEDALVAIEIENKEQTLSDEIAKLGVLRAPLNVLFFYSNETARERRVFEVLAQVRGWPANCSAEFLVMWNKPYERRPHWQPCVARASGMEEIPRFTIL